MVNDIPVQRGRRSGRSANPHWASQQDHHRAEHTEETAGSSLSKDDAQQETNETSHTETQRRQTPRREATEYSEFKHGIDRMAKEVSQTDEAREKFFSLFCSRGWSGSTRKEQTS